MAVKPEHVLRHWVDERRDARIDLTLNNGGELHLIIKLHAPLKPEHEQVGIGPMFARPERLLWMPRELARTIKELTKQTVIPSHIANDLFNRSILLIEDGVRESGLQLPPEWEYHVAHPLIDPIYTRLLQAFPTLNSAQATCPQGCGLHDRLIHLIPHLNDVHFWAPEEIADWLDSLPDDLSYHEKKEESA